MNNYTIILINLLLQFLPFLLRSQNTVSLPLIKSELEFPCKVVGAEFVVSATIYVQDTISKYNLPKIDGVKSVYKLGLKLLLSREAFIQIDSNERKKERNLCLINKGDDSDKLLMLIDENANADFTDEEIDTVTIGQPYYKKLNLLLDDAKRSKSSPYPESENLRFSIPLEILINHFGEKLEISCTNLSKYDLEYALEDTLLKLRLLVNYWHVNFKIKDIDLKDNQTQIQNIRLGEPFFFNGRLRVLDHFDLLNETVDFRTLLPNETPFGYREGYYLNMERLKQLTNSNLADSILISWDKPKYFLLYFWGHWCAPCMSKLDEVKQFSKSLMNNEEIALINYPVIFQNKDTLILDKTIKSNSLPQPQVIQFLKDDCFENRNTMANAACNVVGLVKNNMYPEYLLINADGKILYRGSNKEHELNALLKEMKILLN